MIFNEYGNLPVVSDIEQHCRDVEEIAKKILRENPEMSVLEMRAINQYINNSVDGVFSEAIILKQHQQRYLGSKKVANKVN